MKSLSLKTMLTQLIIEMPDKGVSAINFTVTGGAIKSIAYTGEDDKLAASWRNRAEVFW